MSIRTLKKSMTILEELEFEMLKEISNLSRELSKEEIKKITDTMNIVLDNKKSKYVAIKTFEKVLSEKPTQTI